MITDLLQFMSDRPAPAAVLVLMLGFALIVIGAGLYGVVTDYRDRRRIRLVWEQDEDTRKRMRAMLGPVEVKYPPARGKKGFERRRRDGDDAA